MKAEQNSKSVHSNKIRESSFATLRVPVGWEVCEFFEVFEFVSTNSFSREQMSYQAGPASYFNIHYGDIHATFNQQILDFRKHKSQVPVLIHAPKNVNGDALLRDGDLIIADASEDYNGVGECIELVNINGKKVLSGLHTIAARDKVGRTHEGFRAYLLSHPQVSNNLKRIATGSKVYGVSKTNIATLALALPPLPEQRKIAHILSIWDRATEKTEQLIAQKQQLKKGLMQQLLTGKKRLNHKLIRLKGSTDLKAGAQLAKSANPRQPEVQPMNGYKDTNLGRIPVEWEVRTFGELVTNSQYGLSVPTSPDGNYRMFKMNHFAQGTMIGHGIEKVKLDRNEFLKYKLNVGDILFNRTNSNDLVGKTALFSLSGDYTFASYIVRFTLDSKICNSHFVNYFFNWEVSQSKLKELATKGVSQANINPTNLQKFFFVPVPPLSEQQKIAEVLQSCDREIEYLNQTLNKLETQKKGLMQKLLTGQVRVITNR